jgi:nucleotide-binding universal stress UspA family protein
MPIKSILVPMNAAQSDRSTLDLALSLARPARGHIIGLFVRPDPRDVLLYSGFGGEGMAIGRIMDSMEKEGLEAATRARKAFEAWCARNDIGLYTKARQSDRVTGDWREEVGTPDQVIARVGGLSDLVVEVGLHDQRLTFEQSTIESSLFGSGRPVLVAPKTVPRALTETALIAWNGSREANRAVGAALELLALCSKVLVFCAPEGQGPHPDPAELVQYLGWHGIAVQRIIGTGTGKSIGAELLDLASLERASLLVMGAYTHTRLREMVLGGLTRHVLHHATIPVLLAH